MELPGGLWLRVSGSVLEEVVGGGQRAPLSSDDTRSAPVPWLLCHINSFNGRPGTQCQGIMVPKQHLGLRSCLSPGGRGPGVAGSKRGCQAAGEVAMGAWGKTLVPLLLVVAVVASQSTLLQVEPENPCELLWGYCCGIRGGDREMGR